MQVYLDKSIKSSFPYPRQHIRDGIVHEYIPCALNFSRMDIINTKLHFNNGSILFTHNPHTCIIKIPPYVITIFPSYYAKTGIYYNKTHFVFGRVITYVNAFGSGTINENEISVSTLSTLILMCRKSVSSILEILDNYFARIPVRPTWHISSAKFYNKIRVHIRETICVLYYEYELLSIKYYTDRISIVYRGKHISICAQKTFIRILKNSLLMRIIGVTQNWRLLDAAILQLLSNFTIEGPSYSSGRPVNIEILLKK